MFLLSNDCNYIQYGWFGKLYHSVVMSRGTTMFEVKVQEAWRALRIQSELLAGTDKLLKTGAAVMVFGGARFEPETEFYLQEERLGELLGRAGMPVITGGGPGIMEAANKGFFSTAAQFIGLNIDLPFEQMNNPFQDLSLRFRYFCTQVSLRDLRCRVCSVSWWLRHLR